MCLAVPLEIIRLLPGSKAVVALGQGSRAREERARQPADASEAVMPSDSGRDNAPASGSGELQVDVSLVENPKPGDHVIVHAGYAIEILSLQEAEERLDLFRKMAELMGEEA